MEHIPVFILAVVDAVALLGWLYFYSQAEVSKSLLTNVRQQRDIAEKRLDELAIRNTKLNRLVNLLALEHGIPNPVAKCDEEDDYDDDDE